VGARMNFEPYPIPDPIWKGWRPRPCSGQQSIKTSFQQSAGRRKHKSGQRRGKTRQRNEWNKVDKIEGTQGEFSRDEGGNPEGQDPDRVCNQKAKGLCDRAGRGRIGCEDCQAPGQIRVEGIQHRDNGTPGTGARCVSQDSAPTRDPA